MGSSFNSNRDDAPVNFTNTISSSPIESYLLDGSASAPGSFQNEGGFLDGGSSGSDAESGFSRPDFRQNALVGTVDYYQRHVFLCYKTPRVWPPRIEAAEFDRLPRLLSATLTAKKSLISKQTRLTICEGHDGTETSNGDVLIFPDMIRYRRLTHFDVDTFVDEVVVKDGEWLPGTPELLRGSYIFVCAHGTRDRRCGVCGPPVIARFKEEIESKGLQGKVSVRPCSHIGGHKYAGNVIIFGSNINGQVTGHWYGYVMPDDVPILLEQHIEKGEIVDWLWRGEMGLTEEEQKKSQELRLEANGSTDMKRSTPELTQLSEISSSTLCKFEVKGSGCCQSNGTSPPSGCCQSPMLPGKIEMIHDFDEAGNFTAERKQQILGRNSGRGGCSRKVCTMPTWFESWEREDTYAALAVIGAAASVAVAFNCYKQLT